MRKLFVDLFVLPLVGVVAFIALWGIASSLTVNPATGVADLPSPLQTWEGSRLYIVEPFAKRGELDQGIGAFTWLSLTLVAQGYALALLVGTPVGFLLGASKTFTRMFDPVIQVLRPVSPLAWLPLGYLIFMAAQRRHPELDVPEWAAIFTIAICAMWPTVLNTAVGVRAIPTDYLNVAKVLQLGRAQTLMKILLPAALPYMFTGFRLSLGIAWLVIVAAEMLTGRPGIGGFLWQEYNAGISEHILLSILTIGVVGFLLDRLMTLVEQNVHVILNLPNLGRRFIDWIRPDYVTEGRTAHGLA
ncbi:MAG TPA: nitrate ABC transporter permease [Tepidisphaeraceae bacterium]|nr:nitrate ABC transporter permease [Tepidisphaeraceae bacterium]